jgi:hypothetical protein
MRRCGGIVSLDELWGCISDSARGWRGPWCRVIVGFFRDLCYSEVTDLRFTLTSVYG